MERRLKVIQTGKDSVTPEESKKIHQTASDTGERGKEWYMILFR